MKQTTVFLLYFTILVPMGEETLFNRDGVLWVGWWLRDASGWLWESGGRDQPSLIGVRVAFHLWVIWKGGCKKWNFLQAPLLVCGGGVGKDGHRKRTGFGPTWVWTQCCHVRVEWPSLSYLGLWISVSGSSNTENGSYFSGPSWEYVKVMLAEELSTGHSSYPINGSGYWSLL